MAKTTSKKAPARNASESAMLQRLAKRKLPPTTINWHKLPPPKKRLTSGACPFREHTGFAGVCTQCNYCFNFAYCATCGQCQYCNRKKRELFNVYKLKADQFAGYYEILLLAEALGWPEVPCSDKGLLMPSGNADQWHFAFNQLSVPAKHYTYRALVAKRDGTRLPAKGKRR